MVGIDPDGRTAALNRAERQDVDEARADVREAYERGRKDERASRKRHPFLMTVTFVAAICGVALLALAAVNGSFASGGQVVDQNLSLAADRAGPQVRQAAGQAGQSLRSAGRLAKPKATDSAG
ncbi:hypothetical protein [Phenylobacterium sp.]|jgi:hypothetical protein|uniref:hypothetical protein n=1 Tax=Phenylobacterium sp. TaxID=1871053 RepID=UPI002F42799B